MASNTTKGIINYSSRDYESIMKDFWDLVPKLTDLWKPEADSDPGVVLGKFLASAADMLGVNLDWLANEIFAPSVSQRKNAEKLFGLIGYDLGWYTAARTEVTFRNTSETPLTIDFGFNGSNFCTLNAYSDITNNSRIITYNILPMTNKYGATDTRSRRSIKTENLNVFADTDIVNLGKGEYCTRVAIEGELRSYSISVAQVKKNNYIIKLPSQHIDTTAIWMKARTSQNSDEFLSTQWIQCASPADFTVPEPRFAVTYDSYSNAQIQVSNYLNQLEKYDNNYLTIYWIDCSGVIGCVGTNVLQNLLMAKSGNGVNTFDPDSGDLEVSNLSNTLELPNTYTVTGKSPETAKEAYKNSRNYINTYDSLVTLPDYNRFLNREAGVDAGLVIDCQKALDINLAIYNDENLTDSQKSKMYITNYDFPQGDPIYDWKTILNLGFDPSDPQKFVFASNFKTYTAMCFAIHNDFQSSNWGNNITATPQINNKPQFMQYKPPYQFMDAVKRDYRPLQAMSVDIQFGYLRVFPWYVVGQIYPTRAVTQDVGNNIIATVKEALALHFSPANRAIGVQPTVMEVVEVIKNADSRIDYFDAGSINNPVINYYNCDPEYFNAISFARYKDLENALNNIRIAPEYLVPESKSSSNVSVTVSFDANGGTVTTTSRMLNLDKHTEHFPHLIIMEELSKDGLLSV